MRILRQFLNKVCITALAWAPNSSKRKTKEKKTKEKETKEKKREKSS